MILGDKEEWLDTISIHVGSFVVFYFPFLLETWVLKTENFDGTTTSIQCILLPLVAAASWLVLPHRRIRRQSAAESRLSKQAKGERRIRFYVRSAVLWILLCVWARVCVLQTNGTTPPQLQRVMSESSSAIGLVPLTSRQNKTQLATETPGPLTDIDVARDDVTWHRWAWVWSSVIPYFAALTVILMTLPKSVRGALILGSRNLPWLLIFLRALRCFFGLVHHADPCYYDKQVTCSVYSRFVALQVFVFVGACAYLRTPSLLMTVATYIVALTAIVFGSCLHDTAANISFLVYCAVLCYLQQRSRVAARICMFLLTRQDRERRFMAEEVSNYAGDASDDGEQAVEVREGTRKAAEVVRGGGPPASTRAATA